MNKNVAALVIGTAVLVGAVVVSRTDTAISKVFVSGLTVGNGRSTSPVDVPVSTASFVTGSGTAGDPWSASDFFAFTMTYFGDGSDDDLHITSGTTTLSRSMFYNNLEIDNGAILNPAGYQVFVLGTLTFHGSGSIRRNGSNGNNGANSSSSIGTCGNSTGGAGPIGGYMPVAASNAGGAGNGGGPPQPGASSTTSPFPTNTTAYGGAACTGNGNGGDGTDSTTNGRGGGGGGGGCAGSPPSTGGANAGTVTTAVANLGRIHWLHSASTGYTLGVNSNPTTKWGGAGAMNGGGGGGSCGARATGTNVNAGGGAAGGSGGYIVVMARKFVEDGITGNGAIQAFGGNGGTGGNGVTAANEPGGGGGAGGAGGIIVCVAGSGTCPTTSNVNGGTGGNGGTAKGVAGVGGTGGDGGAGYILNFRMGPA